MFSQLSVNPRQRLWLRINNSERGVAVLNDRTRFDNKYQKTVLILTMTYQFRKLNLTMRKLIVEEWLSLDGFAADKARKLDYFPSSESNRYSDEQQLLFLESVDAILLGRVTYELFVNFWPTASIDTEIIADKLNSIPKFVISNTLKKAPWGNWPEAKIVTGDSVKEVGKMKEQEGKNIVVWGSIRLAHALIQENLVDEYRLHICPVSIGGGLKLFPDSDKYTNLDLTNSVTYDTGVTFLTFEPRS